MTTSRGTPQYHCVAFDAVGTLIHAHPSVAEVYSIIGKRHGASLQQGEIKRRFSKAFVSRQLELTTSESAELTFWKSIVSEVVGEIQEPDACFQELYSHFAKPEAWTVDSDAAHIIRELMSQGIKIAVASNFDHRLHAVLDGHSELKQILLRCISSEIGWRKPSQEFFEHLTKITSCRADEILMVGDDLENDVLGARHSGLDAAHLTPKGACNSGVLQIRSLREVLDLVFAVNHE